MRRILVKGWTLVKRGSDGPELRRYSDNYWSDCLESGDGYVLCGHCELQFYSWRGICKTNGRVSTKYGLTISAPEKMIIIILVLCCSATIRLKFPLKQMWLYQNLRLSQIPIFDKQIWLAGHFSHSQPTNLIGGCHKVSRTHSRASAEILKQFFFLHTHTTWGFLGLCQKKRFSQILFVNGTKAGYLALFGGKASWQKET